MSHLRITDVETILLSYRYEGNEAWKWSGGKTLQRNAVLVRISTDADIQGIGEIGESAYLPRAVERIVEDQFKPMLVREDPFDVERLWQKMYVRSIHWGRKGVIIPIISGLDIALWDIMGKCLGKPVYELLGGMYRDKVRVYASAGMARPIDEIVKEAQGFVAQGFTAVKIRIGTNLRDDVKVVKAVRKGVGDEIDLMVDAGQAYVDFPWDYNAALSIAKRLEDYDLYWLEEPCVPDDIEGYVRLTSSVDLPIAGGENEYTKFGFKDLIVKRAVDILQPDVTRAGGISECKKIAAIAAAFHMQCAPHIFGSGASLMANMHFIASTPNILIMEYDCTLNPLRDNLLAKPLKLENGYVYVPKDVLGLGVNLTDEMIHKYTFKPGDAVHKGEFRPTV